MEKINQFSIERFFLLMKRYSHLNIKTWLIGLGALSGIIFMFSLINVVNSLGLFNMRAMISLGSTIIFFTGYLITSMTYNDLHSPLKSQFYLTLPATSAEKLFSHWLLTSVVYVVLAYTFLSLTLALVSLVAHAVFGVSMQFFNPFNPATIKQMGVYIVTHAIFFLGAIYFRKNNFLKTIFALFVISLVIGLWTGLSVYIASGGNVMFFGKDLIDPSIFVFMETVPTVLKILFWGITAPLFITISYLKLKEREV